MTEALSAPRLSEIDRRDASIDAAIGAGLRDAWADIAQEPLPLMLMLAVTGLALSSALPVDQLTDAEAWASGVVMVTIAPPLAIAGMVALYLVKSAIGIDLFDGPSFLHQYFFD